MSADAPLIQTQHDLEALCEELGEADFVALDTEFVRERTYYPQLCLIQVATERRLALVDALCDLELSPLLAALSRHDLVKVLHAARQDLEIFFFIAGKVPAPVFDSQIAAACLGLGEQLSYSKLAEELLGIDPGKSHARTDWTRRPLAPEQLRYAADDVRYLVSMYQQLRLKLREENREHWLAGPFEALADPGLYEPRPDLAYKRVRGARKLKTSAHGRLVGLAAWRERLAMQMNRPRRWIISDEALLALAALDGGDESALGDVPGLPSRLRNNQSEVILELLRAGENTRVDVVPRPAPPTASQNRLIRRLSAAVREEAERLGTSAALLATRSELAALATSEQPDHPVLRDWRREIIGEKLLAIKLADGGKAG